VNRVLWIVPLLLLAAAGCFSEGRREYGAAGRDPFASDAEWMRRADQSATDQMPAQPPAERTGNVTMVVERIAVSQQDQLDLEAAWRYVDEHLGAAGGQLARRNGVRVGVATGGFQGALQAALNKSRSREIQKTFVTVLSGAAGMIRAGQNTYVEALRYRTPLGQTVLLERTFVGASLVAEPTILPGDRIRVNLHPRFTASDGRVVDLAEMSTEVVVAHGQPMVIGGLDQSSDDVGLALFSWRRERESRKVTLIVTPYIQGAP